MVYDIDGMNVLCQVSVVGFGLCRIKTYSNGGYNEWIRKMVHLR